MIRPGQNSAHFVCFCEEVSGGGDPVCLEQGAAWADVESAAARFDDNRTAESITSSLGPDTDAAQVFLDVKELKEDIAKADATLAFRVEYELQGVHLVEYRYRLRVSNATVNLLINGRTSDQGAEPPALAAQASHIAKRQAARLASNLG